MKTDYLIIGSGLAGLTFGALMAKSGHRVTILEAHYLPGGYGHTFELGDYKFNAQLHYVWNCGEGRSVYNMLKKLGLHEIVTFEHYDKNGFDHMRTPEYALNVPNDYDELCLRLQKLCPNDHEDIRRFITEIEEISTIIDELPRLEWSNLSTIVPKLPQLPRFLRLMPYKDATLQQVFDRFDLPQVAQTMLALQWPDFLLPPQNLSFVAWLMLFSGYMRGAYYPTHHFEHFINALVAVIEENGGEICYEHEVVDFVEHDGEIKGVVARQLAQNDATITIRSNTTICNMDPRRASEIIGLEKFAPDVRNKLNYTYSASNFMAYCAVSGIDLRDYGFGKWNLFHTETLDLNKAFHQMYALGDYSAPSFAMTVPGFLTEDKSDAPERHQIVEFLTVANYQRFLHLRLSQPSAYRKLKKHIFDSILDVVEKRYVPNFRDHLVFSSTGSPTTNERFCWSPQGNSYGSDMRPENIGQGRLNHHTSLKNFYFCNASSGYPGFAGTVWTGSRLYEIVTGDTVL